MAEDRTLELRALLLMIGAGLGVAGMTSGRDWLIYLGLGVALIGGILALWRRRRRD